MIMLYWPSANIRSRWLDIGQALFCQANTHLSSSNKLRWFAHLSSQSEHRICFILPARRFNHKIAINMLYWPGVRLRRLDICVFIDLAFLLLNKNAKKKKMRPIFSHLELTNLGRVVQGLVNITQGLCQIWI